MKKENILSKLNYNLKNYSIEFEGILENKPYSEEAKNLLLSMFYKIQNFYEDYKNIKIDVLQPRELFIQDLIKTISEECDDIEVIDPVHHKMQEKYIIDTEHKKITIFPDENCLLQALYDLKYQCDYRTMSPITSAVYSILSSGYALSESEVIRDFTGWAWNNSISEKYVYNNLIYTNLLILLGYDNCAKLLDNIEKKKINSYIRKQMSQKYGEEVALEFTDSFIRMCLEIESLRNEKLKEEIIAKRNHIIDEYEKMQDKATFISYITSQKKELNSKIKALDKTLNEPGLIEEECKRKNKSLSKKEKKLTVDELKVLIQYERNGYLKELKDCNKFMDPRQYTNMSETIKNKYNLYKSFTFLDEKKNNILKNFVEFEKEFLDCLKIKIEKCESKSELLDIIYEYRYYRLTKYNKEKFVKDNRYLNSKSEEIVNCILEKSEKFKVFETITNDKKINKSVIKEVFNLKTMNLSNIHIEIEQNDNKNSIKYYDGDALEYEKEINKFEIIIKYNKKVKLFI